MKASWVLAVASAVMLAGCGNDGSTEEDSMAPILEKAAKEQGIDSQTVKSRESHTPRVAPKDTGTGQ